MLAIWAITRGFVNTADIDIELSNHFYIEAQFENVTREYVNRAEIDRKRINYFHIDTVFENGWYLEVSKGAFDSCNQNASVFRVVR